MNDIPYRRSEGPSPYAGLDQLSIGGVWRPGNGQRTLKDNNPYTGEVIVEIQEGDRGDLEAAYTSAARAHPSWAAALPTERAAVMRRAAEVMEARREEIISWLVRESGSTRLKASLEYESTHAIMLWAASVPDQVEGRILPTDVPGKEGGACRKPVGVSGVISPWNWPLHLSSRSLAPALAVGNAAVLKPASDTPSPADCCWPKFSKRRACLPECSMSSSAQAARSATPL
jgi:aldehyde dehydrogenase (NAD+)